LFAMNFSKWPDLFDRMSLINSASVITTLGIGPNQVIQMSPAVQRLHVQLKL
jgi:hypothetical protein